VAYTVTDSFTDPFTDTVANQKADIETNGMAIEISIGNSNLMAHFQTDGMADHETYKLADFETIIVANKDSH
jgi:hypothetical protein